MSWEIKRIGEVCDVIPGFAFKSKDLGETGIPLVKIANITDDYRVDIESVQHLPSNLVSERHKKFTLTNGDILIAMTGATAGKVGRIRCSEEHVLLLNQRVAKFKPRKINPDFFWSAISTPRYRTIFYGLGGGAAQPNMSSAQIESVEIPFPPPPVQDRIASILSAYDDLIENNRRRIQLLEESARLLYREWFVRLRFPGHEHVKIIDGVPEGWEKSTVSGLGEIVTGKTPTTKTPENFGGNIPFVKTPDMHRSRVIVETEEFLSERGANTQANKTLPVGSILVACIGARLGVVSITCKPCQTNQQINAVIPSHDHYRYYGLFALIDIKPRLEAMGGGATMPNVNKSKLASIPILIPSQIMLQEFQEFASYTFQQIQLLHQQNVALTQARDLLLPRLMNGEIEA